MIYECITVIIHRHDALCLHISNQNETFSVNHHVHGSNCDDLGILGLVSTESTYVIKFE